MGIPESYTIRELNIAGKDGIPSIYDTGAHLIYSSPATLAYNSPGAEGFGVKRAGLAVPGSVMLIVSPACCGRNTAEITHIKGYEDRFFYLLISETDLVTSRHLKKIPEAVQEIVEFLPYKPSVVMICITCVDALLGTDMERVAQRAEEAAGVRVRPCYMYALTREGRRPPMVHVRESLYSMLKERKRKPSVVNLMGFFAPLDDDCELYDLLHQIGVRHINEISRCRDFDEFSSMSEANFNIVLNPEARAAADDLLQRLDMPYLELTRFYGIERITGQYKAFFKAIGQNEAHADLSVETYRKKAEQCLNDFMEKYAVQDITVSVGEVVNANPFELALALLEYGFHVREIFANPAKEYFPYIKAINVLSPDTRVYSNMEPTMLDYDISSDESLISDYDIKSCYVTDNNGSRQNPVTDNIYHDKSRYITIGKDAAYYHPDAVHIMWNTDRQPYGYEALISLLGSIDEACSGIDAAGLADSRTGKEHS